jgi:hypothetical protein
VAVGAVLMASGLLRPPLMAADGKLAEPGWLGGLWRAVGAASGLALAAALGLALFYGQPWQPDAGLKQRLAGAVRGQGPVGAQPAMGGDGKTAGGQPGAQPALKQVRRTLGDSGAAIELPEGLGEAVAKATPGRSTVYEFGDLSEKQQLLSVIVQPQPRLLKKRPQIEAALAQAVAQVRADKLRDDRVTVLTPEVKSTLDGWPTIEFHLRMQETIQARGLVQARKSSIVVLWYLFTDLLPEPVQVDLRRAVHSLTDGGPAPAATKSKKKKPGRR